MRRITTWLLSTVSALVLLFSYHTSTNSGGASVVAAGDANGATSGAGGTGDTGSGGSTGSGDEAAPTPSPTPSTDSGSTDSGSTDSGSGGSGGSAAASGTVTGDAVQTRFGPVQVEITVAGGKITKSVVTQVPWNDHRDQEINSYAVPILNDEAVQAQSANIDMVSGATYTSDGYIQSLQSAIDKANL